MVAGELDSVRATDDFLPKRGTRWRDDKTDRH